MDYSLQCWTEEFLSFASMFVILLVFLRIYFTR